MTNTFFSRTGKVFGAAHLALSNKKIKKWGGGLSYLWIVVSNFTKGIFYNSYVYKDYARKFFRYLSNVDNKRHKFRIIKRKLWNTLFH